MSIWWGSKSFDEVVAWRGGSEALACMGHAADVGMHHFVAAAGWGACLAVRSLFCVPSRPGAALRANTYPIDPTEPRTSTASMHVTPRTAFRIMHVCCVMASRSASCCTRIHLFHRGL